MIGNEFDLRMVKGGLWKIDGDGPVGFGLGDRVFGAPAELAQAVDDQLKILGLELAGIVFEPKNIPTRAHVVFGRPQ